jgi:membrane protein DedA with SNARE-associated domain
VLPTASIVTLNLSAIFRGPDSTERGEGCAIIAPDCDFVMKELFHQYGAWIVFALVFLESIGLPLPGEAILVSAAIFAGTTQELGIALIVLSAVLGAIMGSTIGFWLGDRYGYTLLLRYSSYIGLTEIRIKIARYLFRRQGMSVVLIARFVAVLRSVIGFIAGANQMPFANFMIANSAGAVAWALFYGLGAYYLGKGVEDGTNFRPGTDRHHSGRSDFAAAAADTATIPASWHA